MTRRDLLKTVAVAPMAAAAQQSASVEAWYDRPMRWAQLAFVEDDPGKYDPKFWLDYYRRIHADAACISAGGCVAFYPTEIPLHYRSKFLGNTDPLGEMVKGCRSLGMNVIARTDPHAAHQEMYEAHPDWIAVNADGSKRKHWADPKLWITCALGPYNFQFMTEVTKEIVSRYKVDGIFSNRWEPQGGQCYCANCQQNFRKASGFDLPRTTDPQNEVYRAFLRWRQDRLFELWRLWDGEIKKINPNAAFIGNSGGGALSSLDMSIIGSLAPTLGADRQARRGLAPVWLNGKNGKEFRATMGRKPIIGLFSVGVEEPYRWKDSVQTPEEIKIWAVDGIANGLRPWVIKFNAKPLDHRWLKPVEELYNWHHQNERYLRNEEPIARVAIVYSQNTARYYGGAQARASVEDHTLGFYQALIEGRVPFEMVHDGLLDPAHISRFRTLILPNVAALSDTQCKQLEAFVRGGGSLVATHETSLYDEWGKRRADFGLAKLFGASFDGQIESPMQNSYLTIEKDPASGKLHPLLSGLEDAPRIINGTRRVVVKAHEKAAYCPLTLVPSYPDLPMEEVYPRVARTDIPQVFLRQHGSGRVAYFPFDLDRTFWEVLSPDHAALLRNAVAWATDEESPVTVTGPGVLDVTAWRQKQSMTVHLVNLTNPMMMKGPYREILPVGAQRVRLKLDGRKPAKVRLLVSGTEAPVKMDGGSIVVDVPSITLHEVVAVDLA